MSLNAKFTAFLDESRAINWDSTYTTVNTYSAGWQTGGGGPPPPPPEGSSEADTFVFNNSATILDVNSLVQSNSALWQESVLMGVYLPLSGGTLTGDLDIQANITSVSSIQFDTTYDPNIGVAPGKLAWNSDESTLDLGVNADVTLQLGQENIIPVKNTSSEIIKNGWAVYATGASGTGSGNITVSAYQGNYGGVSDLYLLGVATQEIAINEFGFITTIGKVRNVVKAEVQESTDLSSWDIGTILYVSTIERGRFTSVTPLPPDEVLPIAIIIGENGTHRTFFVRADRGYTLNELHNVYISSIQNGDIIAWDNVNNYWHNISPYNGTDIKALTGNWNSTYSTVNSISSNWENTFTTVNNNSATWINDVYEEVWVGAGAMVSPTLSGAASTTIPITGSGNEIYVDAFNFDAAAIEYTQFSFLPPTNCNRNTFKCQFTWTASTAGSAVWGVQATSLNDSNSIDIAWGNAQESVDYATGTTTFQITSATNTLSPSGTTNNNSMMLFRAYRNANSGSDTLAVDASLLGVRLQYMMNGGLSALW